MLYQTKQMKIPTSKYLHFLSYEAGEVYSRTLVTFWRIWRKKGVWLSKTSMQKLIRNTNLHSQTVQGIIDKFYENIRSWRELKKIMPTAKMPHRRKRFFLIPYKSNAIRVKNGKLMLSNGKKNTPIVLDWNYPLPKTISISFNNGYRINAVYATAEPEPLIDGETCGIDLGEIHLAVAHTGDKTFILNGRVVRSKRRYQKKTKAHFNRKLSTCKKGSKRYKKITARKNKTLKRLDNQIKDILHKQTTKLVLALKKENVKTVAIGDMQNLKQNAIHQMLLGRVRFMLTYKANSKGMQVKVINEAYSSQTCPKCLNRHKTSTRNYKCPICNFKYHRDGVGAINIRQKQKYMEYAPVVGDMTPPIGIRYIL